MKFPPFRVPAAKSLLAEAIGTFGLVFAGTGAIIVDQSSGGSITHVGVALTFGWIVLVMIYALGDVSGAHLNPAVTIGFWVAQRFPRQKVLPYIASQILGALVASGLLRLLFPENEALGATRPAGPDWQSFLLELILTFLLMLTILNVSTGDPEKRRTAGIAIGSMVALAAMFGGPISGASMNPARSLAPAWVSGHWDHLWIYLIATPLGAMAAKFGCRWVREPGCC